MLIKGILSAGLIAKRKRADAVVYHLFKSDIAELLSIILTRALGLKAYGILHDVSRLDAPQRKKFLNQIVHFISGIIVHNEFSKSQLLETAPHASEKLCVMPHGNYVSRYPTTPRESRARESLGLPKHLKLLLFFGNPRPEKGLDILLSAFGQLEVEEPVHLLIAGKQKPAARKRIEAYIRDHGLSQNVTLLAGHVSDEDLPILFGASSAVVLPYTRVYESGVALMAMSLSRTVIVSDLPIFTDLVASAGSGFVFKSGDAASLAYTISAAISPDIDLEKEGKKARDYVVSERNWKKSAEIFSKFIEQ